MFIKCFLLTLFHLFFPPTWKQMLGRGSLFCFTNRNQKFRESEPGSEPHSLSGRGVTLSDQAAPRPCTLLLLLFSLLSHSVLSISALAIDPLTVNSHRLRSSFTRPSRACSFSGFTSQAVLGDFPQNRCDALQVSISLYTLGNPVESAALSCHKCSFSPSKYLCINLNVILLI